ncbi:MAG: VOC family protein [Polyangiaceae bacterium]|nr:VOC family protein [Polyangiaceae bacterium]
MLIAIRNRFIALGFEVFTYWLRAKHRLRIGPALARLDHVTIPVTDLAVAERFYCDVLGAVRMMTIDAAALRRFGRPPADNGGDGVFHVSLCVGGHTRVDLFLQRDGQPAITRGHPHFAFRIPARAMLQWKARLEGAGVPTDGPLQLGFPGHASLYFNDPSGNHLELVSHGFSRPIPIRPPKLAGLVWAKDPVGASDGGAG